MMHLEIPLTLLVLGSIRKYCKALHFIWLSTQGLGVEALNQLKTLAGQVFLHFDNVT